MSEALRKALEERQRVIDARERRRRHELQIKQERAARPLQSAFSRKERYGKTQQSRGIRPTIRADMGQARPRDAGTPPDGRGRPDA